MYLRVGTNKMNNFQHPENGKHADSSQYAYSDEVLAAAEKQLRRAKYMHWFKKLGTIAVFHLSYCTGPNSNDHELIGKMLAGSTDHKPFPETTE